MIERTPASAQNGARRQVSRDTIKAASGVTFDAMVLKAPGPVAVEFMSYGCAHCAALEPALEQVAQTLEGTEQVVRVNVAVEPALAAAYQITGTPTLVMFLNGEEVGRVEGPSPAIASVLAAVTQPFTA